MTMGIYLLRFTGTDKVYIGQSVNIENRWVAHRKYMRAGKSNYKVQNAFSIFGMPTLEILCTTNDKNELNALEAEAFEIFNSIDKGLNIAKEPDIHLEGELNGGSKYTNDQIVSAFKLLLDPYNSFVSISNTTGVSRSTVSHIANCEAHSWLEREFAEEYQLLKSLQGYVRQSAGNSRKSKGRAIPIVVSPEGVEFEVPNVAVFARDNNLDESSLGKVIRQAPKYKSHKGWTLKKE